MMHGKAIWKPGVGKIAKASRGIAHGPYKGGLQYLIWTPSSKGQHADIHCVMAYDHKTQSFMKNWGHQMCLDKALIWDFHKRFPSTLTSKYLTLSVGKSLLQLKFNFNSPSNCFCIDLKITSSVLLTLSLFVLIFKSKLASLLSF